MSLFDLDKTFEELLSVGIEGGDHLFVEIAGFALHLEGFPQALEFGAGASRAAACKGFTQPRGPASTDERGPSWPSMSYTLIVPVFAPLLDEAGGDR